MKTHTPFGFRPTACSLTGFTSNYIPLTMQERAISLQVRGPLAANIQS